MAAALLTLLLASVVVAGWGSRSPGPRATASGQSVSLRSVRGCLRRAGADTTDVSATRDLRVSGGELAVAFTSFNGYVGVASDHREAAAAATELDEQITVLQQAGHGVVRGTAVYYFDAPLVPRAGARLVEACVAGSDLRASAAMAALARALPFVHYPVQLERRVRLRCRALAGATGCACVYRRAARLFSYAQIDGLGRGWAPRRALAVIGGLLGTCGRPIAAARL